MKRTLFLLIILLYSGFINIYQFSEIPGEWFGDISNVHEYVEEILDGKWPFYFSQSPGPVYHYLIIPFILIFRNHGYETYKLASINVGLIGLFLTYLFVSEFAGRKLALATTLIMGSSFWYIVWSRLGNSQVVIPALVSACGLFLMKYFKKNNFIDILDGALVASLGWYTYPQTFVFPLIFLIVYTLYLVRNKKFRQKLWEYIAVVMILVILTLPFITIINKQHDNFGADGYIGVKIIPVLSMSYQEITDKIKNNFSRAILMLHVRGDSNFRVNVAKKPHLDTVSGIVFLAGMLFLMNRKTRKWLLIGGVVYIIMILPSLSPALPWREIPNSGRTIAVIPLICTVIAFGYCYPKKLLAAVAAIIFGIASYLNIDNYFIEYPKGLPSNNLASGKLIAQYIDKNVSDNTAVYFFSCCFRDAGEPEPQAVAYSLRKTRKFIQTNKLTRGCNEIIYKPALIILNPEDIYKVQSMGTCMEKADFNLYQTEDNVALFASVYIEK